MVQTEGQILAEQDRNHDMNQQEWIKLDGLFMKSVGVD